MLTFVIRNFVMKSGECDCWHAPVNFDWARGVITDTEEGDEVWLRQAEAQPHAPASHSLTSARHCEQRACCQSCTNSEQFW